ncbi:unnamed protein product, partial [Staurois parvus]
LTPCLQGTYTPFLSRPIFSFLHCHTLDENCAVMQHYTHMNFLSFILRQIQLSFGSINHLWVFYFLLNKPKTTEKFEREKVFLTTFCKRMRIIH